MVSLSTWKHGFHPNRVTYDALLTGKSALDSVELGAKYCEADLTCMSVGRGGIPDDKGIVTLDASIMDHEGNCGAVAFMQNYEHVISIARRVMEKTKHVMLAGSGAEAFAEREGFPKTELLTAKAKALYDEWSKQPDKLTVRLRRASEGDHEYVFVKTDDSGKKTEIDRNNIGEGSHDTIGIIGMDNEGRLAGACTTSGIAFKMHGRVGDSPIIGAGLYVVGDVAAAVATGDGELMMRSCAAFHIVEQIRQGIEPGEALERTVERIKKDKHLRDDMQCGVMVIRADGAWSARSLRPGFQLAAASNDLHDRNVLYDVTESHLAEATHG
jgi:N4-(beta-N-acetylglucosaminyl)-L-asparaginase